MNDIGTMNFVVCPMFNEPCHHCSVVLVVRPYTKIKKSTIGKFYEPVGMGKTIVTDGEFCNNDGTHMVADMHYCPARWGLQRGYREKSLVMQNGSIEPKKKIGRPKGSLGKTKQTKKVVRVKKNDTRKIRKGQLRSVQKKAQGNTTVPVVRTEKRKYTRRNST